MGIVKNWKGSWGLPDIGVTEAIGKVLGKATDTTTSGSQVFGNPYTANTVSTNSNVNPYAGAVARPVNITPPQNSQVKGASYSGVPSSIPQNNSNQYINQVNEQTNQLGNFLDQDYENALSAFNSQEQGLRGQADLASQQITNDYGQVMNQLGAEQGTAVQGVNSQLSTAETSANSGMQQARDLFRSTQQSNIAQLSALGISSSSVTEALAERLGVETARRLGGISNSISEVRQNATKELSRIDNFYAQKKTGLEKEVALEKSKISESLRTGLDRVNSARQQASTDKARSRYELITNAQNQIAQITQKAQEFDQQLKEWATKKASAINNFITDPNYLQTYENNINALNQKPGITQSYLGNYGVNPQGEFGYYAGPLKSVKKSDDDPNDVSAISG